MGQSALMALVLALLTQRGRDGYEKIRNSIFDKNGMPGGTVQKRKNSTGWPPACQSDVV